MERRRPAGTDPANCPFRDVSADNPNIEAITWTQGNGYLGGYGNGLFGPEDQMTVEQAMVMLYRFSKSPRRIRPCWTVMRMAVKFPLGQRTLYRGQLQSEQSRQTGQSLRRH